MSSAPLAPPTFRDYLRVLARRWWVVVLGIAGFTTLFVAYSYKGPTMYTSSSEVRFESGINDSSTSASSSSHTSTGSQNADILTEIELIKADRFKNLIIKQNHLGAKSIKQVSAGNVTGTNAIKITVGMSDKNTAALIANRYAATFVTSVREQQTALTQARNATAQNAVDKLHAQVNAITAAITVEAKRIDAQDAALAAQGKTPLRTSALLTSLQAELQQIIPTYNNTQQTAIADQVATASAQPVVDQIGDATPSSTPIQPAPVKYGIVGFVIGIIMGIAGAFVFELLTDKVRTRQDVERFCGLPVLAALPRRGPGAKSSRPVVLTNRSSRTAEAFRAARASVTFLSKHGPMRSIIVAGLQPKDRQESAAANLALTLAASGARVVLVDANLRDGHLHDQFGLPNGNGLTSVLLDATPLTDALHPVEVPNGALRLLPTGPLPPSPADLLATDSLATVLSKLADGADYVILSTSPILPFTDAITLSEHADGVILVATARRTRRRLLADAVAKLSRVDARTLGVLLDRSGRRSDSYEPSIRSRASVSSVTIGAETASAHA